MTGGGATVNVRTGSLEVKLGEPFTVIVSASIKDADLRMSRVYVKLRSVEKVEAMDRDRKEQGGSTTERVRERTETWKHEVTAATADELKANENYEWPVEIIIPNNLNPTYRGRNAFHEYEVYAALDVSGNDPDSNWQQFTVRS